MVFPSTMGRSVIAMTKPGVTSLGNGDGRVGALTYTGLVVAKFLLQRVRKRTDPDYGNQ
jgi:hypothetical protein